MTHKEVFYFIGKCLTISLDKKNKHEIEAQLKTKEIDWIAVVKVSTSHLVFPALYCQLKREKFLQYLPSDLVDYMKHITDLNRTRNEQIIEQAKEINQLLSENQITPIFIKGTAHLLEGLYEDIAERMVGDIDLLLLNDIEKANALLKENNYKAVSAIDGLGYNHRHLPRIVHPNKIAAVELHHKIFRGKEDAKLNIKNHFLSVTKNKIFVLDAECTFYVSVLSKQINDYGYRLKTLSLKHSYEAYLLAKKSNIGAVLTPKTPFYNIITEYIEITSLILSSPIYLKGNTLKKGALNAYFKKPTFSVLTIIWFQKKGVALISFIVKKSYRTLIVQRFKSKLNV
tara:strand:- start:569 stop:1594 length:1026 start_codon:yes stop_codon:yes gene_type:complete